MCGYTCAVREKHLTTTYIWLDIFSPMLLTIVASILLPIRFVIQKKSLQRLQWYRARKMIMQTVLVAGAYIICWLSDTIALQLLVNGVLSFFNPNVSLFSYMHFMLRHC
ncbi:unnamed protein product [Rotaria magnacalcarata]|uniref:Uncharacterized protein n=1 Tax=Rotaria magnacalcarata TaxID=392030 RepID=A0A816LNG5_9BILA|nr:unnamed protein product [Rotaria magnacalcarata]CAF1626776.1 unnamed protein product [Rotaria magnacalcarata]CAF1949557.1 unnamed protein product [Rotaria magnacalcarata]CAF4067293.1 unnamed protein product [Rotaria magnacalcarata]CAF5074057.1 unnamed protein product [Rotaria magnacalcarata]